MKLSNSASHLVVPKNHLDVSDIIKGFRVYLEHRVDQFSDLPHKQRKTIQAQVLAIYTDINDHLSYITSEMERYENKENFFRDFSNLTLSLLYYVLRNAKQEREDRKRYKTLKVQREELESLQSKCTKILNDPEL